MEFEEIPFIPRPFDEAANEAWEREQARVPLNDRHAEKVLSQATSNLARSLAVNPDTVRLELNQLFKWYKQERRLADTESAAEAKDSLQKVAACADALVAALRDLGPAAKGAMTRRSADLFVYRVAEPEDLLKEADPQGLPHLELLDLPQSPPSELMDEKSQKWEEQLKRGGRWIIRLQALATLARRRARQIQTGSINRGPKRLGAILHGPPDEWLMNECLKFIRQNHGQDSLARVMAQAIKEAETAVEPSRGAGRKALRRVSQSPPK